MRSHQTSDKHLLFLLLPTLHSQFDKVGIEKGLPERKLVVPQTENETWMTFSQFLAVSELNFSSDLETRVGVYGLIPVRQCGSKRGHERAADCQSS